MSTSATAAPRFRIAIVGGGIGGLMLALSLSKSVGDVAVDIYEAAESFSAVGAGIAILPRMEEVMKYLGLEEDLKRMVGSTTGRMTQYRKSDQAEGIVFEEIPMECQTLHRADLLQMLIEHIPPNYHPHFSKRLVSYSDHGEGPITLLFKDDTTATCDVLIGADGIKSVVRECMYKHFAETVKHNDGSPEDADKFLRHVYPMWTGHMTYRYLIPGEAIERVDPSHASLSCCPAYFMGKHKFLITYPVLQGRFINVAMSVSKQVSNDSVYDGPWIEHVSQEELVSEFGTWEGQVQTLVNEMKRPLRWVVNTVPSLPTFISGRVAIMGDAAHAMLPYQGSGAGQAIEDAFVLSSLLSEPEITLETLPLAFQVYDEIRRPFAQGVMQGSVETGKMYMFEEAMMKDVQDESSAAGLVSLEVLKGHAEELHRMLEWRWSTTAFTERDRAVETFRARTSRVSAVEARL